MNHETLCSLRRRVSKPTTLPDNASFCNPFKGAQFYIMERRRKRSGLILLLKTLKLNDLRSESSAALLSFFHPQSGSCKHKHNPRHHQCGKSTFTIKPPPPPQTQSGISVGCTCISPFIRQYFLHSFSRLFLCPSAVEEDNPFRVYYPHPAAGKQARSLSIHLSVSVRVLRGSEWCIKFGGIIGCPSELCSIGNETTRRRRDATLCTPSIEMTTLRVGGWNFVVVANDADNHWDSVTSHRPTRIAESPTRDERPNQCD